MAPDFYPADLASYQQIFEGVERALDVEIRLPQWPFRAASGNVDICQFYLAIEGRFGPVLQALADAHHDESVSVCVFEPTADYYRENYGSYPAFTLPREKLTRNYWGAVSHEPGGDPTGALTYTANVVGITGSTGAWAVWAERSWDLAVMVSQIKDGCWRSVGVEFVHPEVALADFTEPDFKVPLPSADRATFLHNFRAREQ
ncbi:hypothetical protein LY12_001321 [Prauserella alba]|nr:hypothetical protein [Prauserella alba]